jgi:hypothetical protein
MQPQVKACLRGQGGCLPCRELAPLQLRLNPTQRRGKVRALDPSSLTSLHAGELPNAHICRVCRTRFSRGRIWPGSKLRVGAPHGARVEHCFCGRECLGHDDDQRRLLAQPVQRARDVHRVHVGQEAQHAPLRLHRQPAHRLSGSQHDATPCMVPCMPGTRLCTSLCWPDS